ncbi:MAG: LytR C-terminal domain-containing protein [Acidimicrobiia bacterium]
MGKHSAEDERAFWKSLAFFGLKWVGVVALPLLAVWGVWRLVNEPDRQVIVASETKTPAASPSGSPTPEASPTTEAPPPEESPAPPPQSPSPKRTGKVQVLNGAAVSGIGQKAADRLKEAGYEIVAVQNASRRYEKTTIFYQEGSRPMAEEIAALFGFGIVEAAPANLSKDVPVTVVTGDDYK